MRNKRRERGFTLIALMAFVAIMAVGLLAAERAWSSLLRQEMEDELIFRGEQYVDALDAYRKKRGTLPTKLEELTKDKPRFIRKLYPEPMMPDGEWYIIHPGDPILNPKAADGQAKDAKGILTEGIFAPKVGGDTPGFGQTKVGPIIGVASRSTKTSFKTYNNRRQYNQWLFLADPPTELAQRRELKKQALLKMLGVHQVISPPPAK